MDCILSIDQKNLRQSRSDRTISNSDGNDRLVELLSLFSHDTSSIKEKSKTQINTLRDEIQEVLERNIKSEHEKTTEKALYNVARIRADMNTTLESRVSVKSTDDTAETSRVICDGNVRVLIAEQMVDLEGQLEYTSNDKVKSRKIRELEQKIKRLENELSTERSKSSTILKHAKESDKKYKEVKSRLDSERKATERCQGIAKTLNGKLHKIRSLLEEAASKQNPSWQSKINEMKLQLDDVTLAMESSRDSSTQMDLTPRKNKH